MRILAAWIGQADLDGSTAEKAGKRGPIHAVLQARTFDRVLLLANWPQSKIAPYVKWLRTHTSAELEVQVVELSTPTAMGEIYRAATNALKECLDRGGQGVQLTLHLSPGTPAMATVWVLLGKTRFPAAFIQASPQAGVEDAEIPFDISAELLPAIFEGPDRRLASIAAEVPANRATFGDIVYRSDVMSRLVHRARKVAARDNLPVLIEGESGTGKELLANAIFTAGPRKDKPLKVLNCGAIPAELINSELFGHKRGSFTGANSDRKGYFEEAHGGTLFLDEIGEMPLDGQVRLLRVLQEGEVTPVGATEPRHVNVRVIAATNRNLAREVAAGRFREDLYYRLAVATLYVPPLREREGDIGLLIDALLERVNEESRTEPNFVAKTLAPGARRTLLQETWPGNVRQLQNTLRRAVVFSEKSRLEEEDIREHLLQPPKMREDMGLLGPIGNGVDLISLQRKVAAHYLRAAMEASGGRKARAAQLVGLGSHQVFNNWLRKYAPTLTATPNSRGGRGRSRRDGSKREPNQ